MDEFRSTEQSIIDTITSHGRVSTRLRLDMFSGTRPESKNSLILTLSKVFVLRHPFHLKALHSLHRPISRQSTKMEEEGKIFLGGNIC